LQEFFVVRTVFAGAKTINYLKEGSFSPKSEKQPPLKGL
jgi:hypothetical protein